MSFDVNLGFKVTTDGLNETISNIDKLTTAVTGFNKAQNDSTKASASAAKVETDAAKVRKANADALTAETKALKAKEELDKATANALKAEILLNEKNEQSITKKTKATQSDNSAIASLNTTVSTHTGLLERKRDQYDYMTQGFSSAQAATLAMGKAVGLTTLELKELGDVLLAQRRLTGGNTFDKSTSGLLGLKTQVKETVVALDQYNKGNDITKQQTRELARDFERLTAQMQSQGKTADQITAGLKEHEQEFVKLSTALNAKIRVEKEHERVQRESANATRAVSKEEERMISIMNSLNNQTNMNASFSEKAAIAEANYARNLRLAGVSAEDATKRLSTYRQQQVLVAAEEEKRQAKFLQRGLQPQIGDTVVSLAGGQNPLTVLLQQGDQIRGLIAQSGLQGEALAASMRAAFTGTVESIKMTAVAMSSVLGGAIVGVGKMFVDLGSKVLVPTTAFQKLKNELLLVDLITGESSTRMKIFEMSLKGLTVVAGLAAFAFIAFAASAVAAFVAVSKEQDELSKSLLRSGASLGMTKESATEFAKSFSELGVSTSKATELITAFAKEGGFTRDQLRTIIPVAEEMRKVFGDSVEDVVKSFSKLKNDPVKALFELGKSTGLVSIEVIRLVEEQVRLGNSTEAASIAIKEGVAVNKTATEQMRRDYSTLGTVLMTASNLFSIFWEKVKGSIYDDSATDKIVKKMSELSLRINAEKDGWLGSEKALKKYTEAYATLGKELVSIQTKSSNVQESKLAASAQAGALERLGEAAKQAETPLAKYQRTVNAITADMKLAGKESVGMANGQAAIAKAQKEYNEALDKANKPSKEARAAMKQAIKDEEVYGNLIAKSVNFTETYSEEVQALNRYAAKAKLTQDEYNQAYFALLEKQPYFIALKKDEADGIKAVSDAIKLENQLLGKAEDLGKDYYDQLVKIGLAHATGTFSPARIEAMIQRLNEATPAAKALSKAWEDVNAEILKNQKSAADRSEAATVALDSETEKLALQLSLVGKSEEQKKREIKLLEIKLARIKEIDQIEKDFALNSNKGEKDRRIAEAFNREEQAKRNLNTEIAVDAATKYADEMKKASDDIASAISTALFEGGAEGGKKLRSALVALFRKPIDLQINATVNQSGIANLVAGISNARSGANSSGSLTGPGATPGQFNLGTATQSIMDFGLKLESFGSELGGTTSTVADFGSTLVQNSGSIAKGVGYVSTAISYIDALSKFKSGSYGEAIGQAAGQYFGGDIGAAIGAKIGAAIDKYFGGKGGPKQESGFGSGLVGASESSFSLQNNKFAKGISENVTQAYTDIAKSLGLTVKDLQVSVFTSVDSVGDALTQLQVIASQSGVEISNRSNRMGGSENVGRTPEELDAAIKAEVNLVLLAALKASDLPEKYKTYIEGSTDITTAVNTVAALQKLDSLIGTLGTTFKSFTDLSIEASLQMVNAFGGVEGMISSLSSYYQNFYSESERQANTLKSVEGAFKSLGITMPDISKGSDTARAEFRKLVEAQDLSTEAGRRNYATLLQLSGTFAELTPLLEDAKNAWKDLTQSILEEVQRIRGVINSGENQSLSSAQSAFDLATTLARAGDKDAAASLPELSKTLLEIAAKQATSLTELRRIQYITAGSLEQTTTVIPKFAAGGDYSGGLALVGEKGPELINFSSGGYVANASNTANLLDNNSVLDLLDKVNTNLDGMRYELRSNVTHVAKTAKLLDRVIPDGASIQVTVVNP